MYYTVNYMKFEIKNIFAIIFIILFAVGAFSLVFWMGSVSRIGGDIFGNGSDEKNADIEGKIPKDAQMIIVDKPKANETIESPLKIEGMARGPWFFEASFPIRLLDPDGNELAVAIATALSDWMTTSFVPFEATLEFDPGNLSEGSLVFEKDNPSGLPENDQSFVLPVFFKNGEETTIKVFFGNLAYRQAGSKLDPNQDDCWTVYAVNRTVPKVARIGQSAMEELLKGPTEEEKEQGYFSSIQEGTELNGLSIQHGVAFVDFNEKLDEGIGGSCRVSSIRSQIEQTLKQFPTVKEVQIYIGERIDDVLQP